MSFDKFNWIITVGSISLQCICCRSNTNYNKMYIHTYDLTAVITNVDKYRINLNHRILTWKRNILWELKLPNLDKNNVILIQLFCYYDKHLKIRETIQIVLFSRLKIRYCGRIAVDKAIGWEILKTSVIVVSKLQFLRFCFFNCFYVFYIFCTFYIFLVKISSL